MLAFPFFGGLDRALNAGSMPAISSSINHQDASLLTANPAEDGLNDTA
jgi:hypothetical protein